MFLSRVEIPWNTARNPYDVHRALWCLFPGHEREARKSADQHREGFLFRFESHATGRPARVLLLSRWMPQPTSLLSLTGSREFRPQPSEGQRLAFILTANPVKTIVDAEADKKPEKLQAHALRVTQHPEKSLRPAKSRVPLIKEEEQKQWLARKLAGSAELESADVLPHAPLYFRKKGGGAGKLGTCTFEGTLRVSSPERLAHLLENGIGPAKAFGCGLLLVRRL